MYKRVYGMSNENIGSYREIFNFKGKDVLCILGSGDQYINSLLYGAKDIDIVDINYTSYIYFRIKIKGIKYLEYEEFIRMFLYREFNDIDLYLKLYRYLDEEELEYYRYIFNNKDRGVFTINILERLDIDYIKRMNPYIDRDNYYIVKDILLNKGEPLFRKGNFIDIDIDREYDILLLSNIYDYIGIEIDKYMEIINKYKNSQVLVNYSWNKYNIIDGYLDYGLELYEVDGVMSKKNYILKKK